MGGPDVRSGTEPGRTYRSPRSWMTTRTASPSSSIHASRLPEGLRSTSSVEFIELPGNDHFLSSSTMRVRALIELEKFLAPYLAARPN